jgi:hypothetical protein
MPQETNALARANQLFAYPAIAGLSADLFDGTQTLSEMAQDWELTDDELAFVTAIPAEIQGAITAFISGVLQLPGDERPPITLAWRPSYEWGLTIAYGGGNCHTIEIWSRHPSDLPGH